VLVGVGVAVFPGVEEALAAGDELGVAEVRVCEGLGVGVIEGERIGFGVGERRIVTPLSHTRFEPLFIQVKRLP
jgi:hypothetical protein